MSCLESTLFLADETLTALVGNCGAYVGVGVGLALAFYMLGYVVYFIIDFVRGGI